MGIVTIGLGIGANTTIFTFVNAILLQPVPFPNSRQLVMAWMKRTGGSSQNRAAPADYLDWRDQSHGFTGLEAYQAWTVNLTGSGDPERLLGFRVSPDFFQTLGARFALGRGFLPQEGKPGQDREAVLSYGLWQRNFGGQRDVVGHSINLDGGNYRVVGVVAPNFEWPPAADVWAPLVLTDAERQDRAGHSIYAVGRIKPALSLAQAQSEMDIIARELARQNPKTNTGEGVNLVRLPGQFGDSITNAFLLLLMGAVTFVLLIACLNVANLLLADATRRQREVAVRTVLGASRRQIVMQSLTESTLLCSFGAALGLFIAFWGVSLLRAMIPPDQLRYIPGWGQMQLSARGVVFAFVCALVGGLGSGILPALQASRPALSGTLKEGGWGSTSGFRSRFSQSWLIGTQFALSLILLVGTGLMVKGFGRMGNTEKLGFQGDNVLTMSIRLPGRQTPHQIAVFYEQVLAGIQRLPGVQQAGTVSTVPFKGPLATGTFTIEGRAVPSSAEQPRSAIEVASKDYFHVMRIPLIEGRTFSERDGEGLPPVVILSKSAVREFWPSQNPIGSRIHFGAADSGRPWMTIVGVVGNVKQFWLDTAPQAAMYVHFPQSPYATPDVVIRTSGEPALIGSGVRQEILKIDGTASIYGMKSMQQLIHEMLAGIGVAAGMMAVFGGIAMILAAAGVYGMIAYTVSCRQREIGIRIAMGALPGQVVLLFVRRATKLAVIGLAVGLPAAFALTQIMSHTLFGVVTLDPMTFLVFVLALMAVATLAAYLPARRATKVDATVALRYE